VVRASAYCVQLFNLIFQIIQFDDPNRFKMLSVVCGSRISPWPIKSTHQQLLMREFCIQIHILIEHCIQQWSPLKLIAERLHILLNLFQLPTNAINNYFDWEQFLSGFISFAFRIIFSRKTQLKAFMVLISSISNLCVIS
jgi:hypothetical protein